MNEIVEGVKHITDPNAWDHMLFLVALTASLDLSKLGKTILLATAFTVGHSLTLILAGLEVVRASSDWIEFLIPVSIVFMALRAILGYSTTSTNKKVNVITYAVTVLFGLIHGLGFSSFFRMISEKGESIVMPLLRFNLGVEVGQIIILLVALSLFSLGRAFGVTSRSQQLVIGGMAFGLSAIMAIENWPL